MPPGTPSCRDQDAESSLHKTYENIKNHIQIIHFSPWTLHFFFFSPLSPERIIGGAAEQFVPVNSNIHLERRISSNCQAQFWICFVRSFVGFLSIKSKIFRGDAEISIQPTTATGDGKSFATSFRWKLRKYQYLQKILVLGPLKKKNLKLL